MTPDQLIENLNIATGSYTKDSTTVSTSAASIPSEFDEAFLVPGDTVTTSNPDTGLPVSQGELYHMASFSGGDITLTTGYAGETAPNKKVGATRLGGYWTIPAPGERQVLEGVGEIARWEDICPMYNPNPIGNNASAEGAGNSKIGTTKILTDKSAAGMQMLFSVDPYEDGVACKPLLPRWVSGIAISNQDNPGRALAK